MPYNVFYFINLNQQIENKEDGGELFGVAAI